MDFFKPLEVPVIQVVEKRSPRYGLVLVLQFAPGGMAWYQEEAQSDTKDNCAGQLHTMASPKRLLASLLQSLGLHKCLLIEIRERRDTPRAAFAPVSLPHSASHWNVKNSLEPVPRYRVKRKIRTRPQRSVGRTQRDLRESSAVSERYARRGFGPTSPSVHPEFERRSGFRRSWSAASSRQASTLHVGIHVNLADREKPRPNRWVKSTTAIRAGLPRA